MKRIRKNKGLYLKELIKKIFNFTKLVKEVTKLKKQVMKLENINKELQADNVFLFNENQVLKAKLLTRERNKSYE